MEEKLQWSNGAKPCSRLWYSGNSTHPPHRLHSPMTSPYETPLVDLMDNVAMAAMEQFIALYAPEKTEGPDATIHTET